MEPPVGIEPTTYSLRVGQRVPLILGIVSTLALPFVFLFTRIASNFGKAGNYGVVGNAGDDGTASNGRFFSDWACLSAFMTETLVMLKTVIPFEQLARLWTVEMSARSLSPRTIDERLRVVNQFTQQTGVNAQVANFEDITLWLAALPSAIPVTHITCICEPSIIGLLSVIIVRTILCPGLRRLNVLSIDRDLSRMSSYEPFSSRLCVLLRALASC